MLQNLLKLVCAACMVVGGAGLIVLQATGHGFNSVTPLVAHPGEISVLIVEDINARKTITPEQRDVIEATGPGSFREYCATHCRKDAAGVPQFRVVDQSNDMSLDEPWAQQAMKLPRQSLPWIYVSTGKAGWNGPIDGNTKAKVKQWGGP